MKYFYERKLPHYVVSGYAYFITSRLVGSIPSYISMQLMHKYQVELNRISHYENAKRKRVEYENLKWNYFTEYDSLLDKQKDPHWFKIKEIANLLKDAILFRDGKDYDLVAFTIMSNHIHMVIVPYLNESKNISEFKKEYPLGALIGSLKKYTAINCNKILKRNGQFWQHENYDHIIRNSNELNKIVNYVLNNPVKIGLVNHYSEYQYNYYNPKFITM